MQSAEMKEANQVAQLTGYEGKGVQSQAEGRTPRRLPTEALSETSGGNGATKGAIKITIVERTSPRDWTERKEGRDRQHGCISRLAKQHAYEPEWPPLAMRPNCHTHKRRRAVLARRVGPCSLSRAEGRGGEGTFALPWRLPFPAARSAAGFSTSTDAINSIRRRLDTVQASAR